MRILAVGGSGIVGSLIVPRLAEIHEVRVFDLRPPQREIYDYFQGDVTCYEDLKSAIVGMEALLYMAMGSLNWSEISGIVSAYDVNIKGLHLALRAAHESNIQQAVYTSTMSVYGGDLMQRHFSDEGLTPDATDLYGFTKLLGEEVCLNATRLWGMHINALRLCFPTAEDKWYDLTTKGTPTIATTVGDLTRAILAALNYQGGFNTFTISGDYDNKIMNMSKAKKLLNWEPLARPNKRATDEQG
jgi:nucleoside-diphosphate-sugar epimerase